MTEIEERNELVKSIKNRCEIYLYLCQEFSAKTESWIPTLLEDNHRDSQELIDRFCVVERND